MRLSGFDLVEDTMLELGRHICALDINSDTCAEHALLWGALL